MKMIADHWNKMSDATNRPYSSQAQRRCALRDEWLAMAKISKVKVQEMWNEASSVGNNSSQPSIQGQAIAKEKPNSSIETMK